MNKAAFYDRDGVLNELVHRDGGLYSPRSLSQFKIIKDSKNVTKHTKHCGYLNIIVSNQPDIERGLLSKQDLSAMTQQLLKNMIIDDVLYCMHDDGMCDCRKPLPGLIYAAQKKWNIYLSQSIMIGDTEKDYLAAKHSNVDFYLVSNDENIDTNVENRISHISEILNIIN